MSGEECPDCKAHLALAQCTINLKNRMDKIDGTIDKMRAVMLGTLVSACLTLLAVIGTLIGKIASM